MNGEFRIKSLDSIRGLAALSVLFFHCYTVAHIFHVQVSDVIEYLEFPWNIPLVLGINFLSSGRAAVILFFVLSGFVLTISLLNNKQSYKKFIISRFFRIYPVLFVTVIIGYGLHYVIGESPVPSYAHLKWYEYQFSGYFPLTLRDLAGHLALTGIMPNHTYLNAPIWSLVHEMRISLILPFLVSFVLFFSNRSTLVTTVVLFLFLSFFAEMVSDFLLMNKYVTKHGNLPEETLLYSLLKTVYYSVFFVAGILMAIYRKKISIMVSKIKPVLRTLLAILSVIFLVYYDSNYTVFVDYLRGLGAVILISLAFSWNGLESSLMTSRLQWLGHVSYSLYLVHWIVMYPILALFGDALPLWVVMLSIVLISLVCAQIMSKFVEYPCINLGKKILSKMK